ncbi:hypothetical protein BCR42DRAFT_450158 [Absidia repens]|uniref:Uncharacterized protein n=1 Tax=Absidia repens TaxID=90262 RepID=A0A1X2IMM4_9FUNG|nr:hypothetical protein BCR42DRAFT_450158 [Absidia repens]
MVYQPLPTNHQLIHESLFLPLLDIYIVSTFHPSPFSLNLFIFLPPKYIFFIHTSNKKQINNSNKTILTIITAAATTTTTT